MVSSSHYHPRILVLASICIFVAHASAHGFVYRVTIDKTSYEGNFPGGPTSDSIIRQITQVEPVKGAKNPALTCGHGARPAALYGEAKAGSLLTFDWRGGDLSPWPHNVGPLITYMTQCPDSGCAASVASARWFKISQGGKSEEGHWLQDDLRQKAKAVSQIPTDLAAGTYLIRHEIIALHLASQPGGAEFYPACIHVKVSQSGAGSSQPRQDEMVAFPGGYSDDHPGIYVPDEQVYNPSVKYIFPGPPIVHFAPSNESRPLTTDDNGRRGPVCQLRRAESMSKPIYVANLIQDLTVTGKLFGRMLFGGETSGQ